MTQRTRMVRVQTIPEGDHRGWCVNRETLRLWMRQAGAGQAGETPARRREAAAAPVASDTVLGEENRQLRKKLRQLEAERGILRRAAK